MSEIAGNIRTTRHEVAATPALRARRFLLQPAALGLLLALLATVLLGRWFANQSSAELAAQTQGRMAILEASALAEAVGGLAAANPDDTAPLQAAMADWVRKSPGDDHVMVLRLSGARLLASTRATDLRGELPRRLSREEKWLFDLGQELRAAIDTNTSEGVFRKAQIDIARPAAGRLRVTVPYRIDGAVAGIVQHERPLPEVTPSAKPLPWLPVVILPVALFWLVALLLQRRVAPETRAHRWIAFGVALALFVLAWWAYSNRVVDSAEAA
ncbi:MAG TPA: hypothetical protein VFP48_00815, partial [Steroidobacteraceae bacterium]|nr:hypothetical protein [Steroidobacteraceae bacterium]